MLAPLAVRVALVPAQIEGEEAEGLIVGVGLTTNPTVEVVRQPNALAPVTEYTVVPAGLTVTLCPLRFPGFQV